jgi:hypothetical protein
MPPTLFRQVAETESPQGVLAVVRIVLHLPQRFQGDHPG